jgi:hypothetical protein
MGKVQGKLEDLVEMQASAAPTNEASGAHHLPGADPNRRHIRRTPHRTHCPFFPVGVCLAVCQNNNNQVILLRAPDITLRSGSSLISIHFHNWKLGDERLVWHASHVGNISSHCWEGFWHGRVVGHYILHYTFPLQTNSHAFQYMFNSALRFAILPFGLLTLSTVIKHTKSSDMRRISLDA